MGADIHLKQGVVLATAPRGLRPVDFELRSPSVGATHQLMMAAARTPGTSVFRNVAREPEIVALAEVLTQMGAQIEGAGGDIIAVHGEEDLGGASIRIIGDRIEAATYALASVVCSGDIEILGFSKDTWGSFAEILEQLGAEVSSTNSGTLVRCSARARAVSVTTAPFPGFATDIQAPLMAALTTAAGTSTIDETIFEGRFGHATELCRMGAQITISGQRATIEGITKLAGAPVEAADIRAAAALVIAGLGAEGVTRLHEPHHLWRGYAHIESKLQRLGAKIRRRIADPEDFLSVGC